MKIFNILSGQRKSLLRDPMSILMAIVPFIILILVKLVLPIFVPEEYNHFIKMMVYLITPTLLGMMLGLLLTDEKDEAVHSYISVTPLGLTGYLAVKTAAGVLFALVVNFILSLLLIDEFNLNVIVALLLSSGLVTYYGLLIFMLSKDKVEALTRGKLFTFTIFAAVVPYFIESRLTWFLVIFPTFWLEKIYNLSTGTFFSILYLICGLLVAGLTIVVTNFLTQSR